MEKIQKTISRIAISIMTLGVLVLSGSATYAAGLTGMSDTLSSQKGGDTSNHLVVFTSTSSISSGTIVVDFSNAVASTGSVDETDIDLAYGTSGSETDYTIAASAGAATWGAAINSLTKKLTLTYPTSGGTTVGAGERVIIKVGTNASGGSNQMTNAATANSIPITITTPSDSGTLAIALIDSASIGVSGDASSAIPDAAPTSLSAATIGSTQINLSWTDNASNEDGYRIERRESTSGSFTQIASTGASVTTFSDLTVTQNKTYIYRVRAYNTAGNSSYSNEAQATTTGTSAGGFVPPPTSPPDSIGGDEDETAPEEPVITPEEPTEETEAPTEEAETPTEEPTEEPGEPTPDTPETPTSPEEPTTPPTTPTEPTEPPVTPTEPSTPTIPTGPLTPEDLNVTLTPSQVPAQFSEEGRVCSVDADQLNLCIPLTALSKPVTDATFSLDVYTYNLTLDPEKGCYTTTVLTPAAPGLYEAVVEVQYTDGSTERVVFEVDVKSSCEVAAVTMEELSLASTLANLNEQTGRVIQENRGVLNTVGTAALATVLVGAPSVAGNLLGLYQFIIQLIQNIISLLGYRRKKKKYWGTVYNSITKEPVDLAIVRLYSKETDKLIETHMTDREGRFSFLSDPGSYYIKVRKVPYTFPTKIVAASIDGEYKRVYRGDEIKVKSADQEIAISIPLDPPQAAAPKKGPWQNVKRVLEKIAPGLAITSFIISLALLIYAPSLLQGILFVVATIVLLVQFVFVPKYKKRWGVVYDATSKEPLPLCVVAIFNAENNKLLKTRLTDHYGRFNFLTPEGKYKLLVLKKNYTFPASTKTKKAKKYRHPYFGEEIEIKKKNQIVRADIPLQRRPLNGESR